MPTQDVFNRELATAAREMQDDDSIKEAMGRAVLIATEIIPGADAAGVCVVYRIDTHATSTDELRQADALQHELDEGPCLDALQREDTVRSNDLSADERWPQWGPRVAEEVGPWQRLRRWRTWRRRWEAGP